MVNACFLEFEINSLKNDHMFESAVSKFDINVLELSMLANNGYIQESEEDGSIYEEAVGTFLQKVKEFFNNMIENIKNLVKDCVSKVQAKFVARDIEKKLSLVKQSLAANKSIALKGKVSYFHTTAYIKEYDAYIKLVVTETKKLYNKEYKDFDEYNKARIAATQKIQKFFDSSLISTEEKCYIDSGINEFYKYSENEIKHWKTVVDAFQKTWVNAVNEMKDLALKEDDESKIQDIKSDASDLTAKCSKGLKTIVEAPVKKLNELGTRIKEAIATQKMNAAAEV